MQTTYLKKIYLLILIFLSSIQIHSWPGDQESLSCIPETDKENLPNRKDIEAHFKSAGIYATNGKTKEENQAEAIKRVKDIVRANHDMDFEVTKLGDSLSDLVDFYGVATPRKLFPNLGDAGGTYGGNPIYMDSWDDYMTAGAGK